MTQESLRLEGGLIRVHVNQHNLKRRIKKGGTDPCYTIKHKSKTFWAREVHFCGPSRLVESIDNPLGCGARLWVETEHPVLLSDVSAPSVHQGVGL